MSIREMIENDAMATFQYFQDGNLWYTTDVGDFSFPIPVKGVRYFLLAKIKAARLTPFIRKQMNRREAI